METRERYRSLNEHDASTIQVDNEQQDVDLHHAPSATPRRTSDSSSRLRKLMKWRRYLILILAPIVFLPLPLAVSGSESRCAYCILVMAVYWVTEVVPLAVTALLPLVMFPLLGVLSSKKVSTPYFKDTNVLFIGGLIVAVAVEDCMLHKRIALRVLLLVGAQPRRLMMGFMITTAFLSMWISNTATTAMMVPIVEAVLGELKQDKIEKEVEKIAMDLESEGNVLEVVDAGNPPTDSAQHELEDLKNRNVDGENRVVFEYTDKNQSRNNFVEENPAVEQDVDQEADKEDQYYTKMAKAFMLCIAYAANIGGTATLTGTAPNLVFAGQANTLHKHGPGISFASWFGYAFPEMLILLVVAWVWLQVLFLGFKCKCFSRRRTELKDKRRTDAIKQILVNQYRALGPMSFAEKAVLGHFIMIALLWLFRDPKFMPGWAIIFKKDYVRDATVAIFISFSLFVFPSEKPKIFCWNPTGQVTKPPKPLLEWKTMTVKFPWNIVILLGSGFALAEACKVSGLSMWLGYQLANLYVIPPWAIVAIVCALITGFTEVTSNTATATIFLPILASLGESICVHPWYLMLPATVACSFAFMLPVATPPNAIVFSGGFLKVKDMAKAGLGMNIFACIILLVCVNTYGVAMFDLRTFPVWASKYAGQPLGNITTNICNVTVA